VEIEKTKEQVDIATHEFDRARQQESNAQTEIDNS
jgi:hypothetical protein